MKENFYKYQLKYLIINQKCNKDIHNKEVSNKDITTVINNKDNTNQDSKIDNHINKEDTNKDNMNKNNIIPTNIQKKTVFTLQICHNQHQENNQKICLKMLNQLRFTLRNKRIATSSSALLFATLTLLKKLVVS